MAECQSMDSTKFIIQLYRGRGSYEHGVIVEVQRMFGCCIKFMQSCRSILQAAKTNEEVAGQKLVRVSLPENVSEPEKADDSCPRNEKTCTASVKMNCICRLLFEKGIDSDALGLEMLRDATDSSKAGANDATKAVKIMLEGKYFRVFNYLTSLIDVERTPEDCIETKFRLRFLALCILSNVLVVAESIGHLSRIIEKHFWFIDSLVVTLIKDLKNAKVCSSSALLAANCLKHVVGVSRDAKAKAIEIDAIRVIVATNEYGKCSHALLEKETKCCAQLFQCH